MKLRSSTYNTVFDQLGQLSAAEVAKFNSPHSIDFKKLLNVMGVELPLVSYALEQPMPADLINDHTISEFDWMVGLAECVAGRTAILMSVTDDTVLRVIPKLGMPLIIHMLNQSRACAFDRDVDIPTIVMAPEKHLDRIQTTIDSWASSGPRPRVVVRPSTLAFNALGEVSRDPDGSLHTTPTGSGDVWDTLVSSGIADEFPDVTNFFLHFSRNGIWAPHLGMLGQHVKDKGKITVEVAADDMSDYLPPRFPCFVDGDLIIAEHRHFNDDQFASPFVALDSYIISREALSAPIDWSWAKRRIVIDSAIYQTADRTITQLTRNHKTRMVYVDTTLRYHPVGGDMINALGEKLCAQTG